MFDFKTLGACLGDVDSLEVCAFETDQVINFVSEISDIQMVMCVDLPLETDVAADRFLRLQIGITGVEEDTSAKVITRVVQFIGSGCAKCRTVGRNNAHGLIQIGTEG